MIYQFEFTEEQGNLILAALGKLPYGTRQCGPYEGSSMIYQFEFTEEQGNLILAALGKLPYETSAGLIANIQQQAEIQRLAQARKHCAESLSPTQDRTQDPAQEPTQLGDFPGNHPSKKS